MTIFTVADGSQPAEPAGDGLSAAERAHQRRGLAASETLDGMVAVVVVA